jgi:Tfp pilus tip-associated adhesin PilY1
MVDSERRLNLLYDNETWHYHVIASLTGAMANGMYVVDVVKAAKLEIRTNVRTHAANACPYRQDPSQSLGSRAKM